VKLIKVVSLFSGVGGICLAFKQVGFNVIWANDIDKYACITYRSNFPTVELIEGDIQSIASNSIPECDIITAGFPCQPFSIAGYQKGLNDPRGRLFYEIIRIVHTKKPKIIFLENVKNLVSHNNGITFKNILDALEKEGYYVKYAILNSLEYGNVPQNRERVYIVGFLDKAMYEAFEFPEPIPTTVTIYDIIRSWEKKADKYYYKEGKYYELLKQNVDDPNTVYQIRRIYVRKNKKGVCPTLTANMGEGGHNVPIVIDNYGFRKLTPRECFLLQGFPEDFILPSELSDSKLYKQAGNAVTVTVVKRIAEKIFEACLVKSSI